MRIFFLLLTLFISACSDEAKEEHEAMNNTSSVTLKLDVSIEQFLSQTPVEFKADCLQEADFCLYEFDRPMGDSNLPSVLIERNSGSLVFDHVASIVTSTNTHKSSVLDNFKFTVRGLPDNSTHDANKAFIYELIEKIRQAGWQRFISPASPRIPGSEAEKINSTGSIQGVHVSSHPWFDPAYTLDLPRWMKWGSFYTWSFYNDGAHMKLNAWRQNSPSNPETKATYLITVELQADAKYWQNELETEEQKNNWISLVPELRERYLAIRERDEKILRSFGIEIDDAYQDPTIKQLNP